MNSISPNYFIHGANVLLLAAYSVRDILWLRVFAVASSLIAIPYFVLQPNPLWAPMLWSVLFASINLFQSWRLIVERRPLKLTPEEEALRQLAFPELTPRKLLQVLSIGSWINAEPGERFIERGRCPQAALLLVAGKVKVSRDGIPLSELVPGSLVGSALLLTGVPADVDAVAAGSVRAVRWDLATLQRYLEANPDTRMVMQRHLARDLAGKLEVVSKNVSAAPAGNKAS